jgi:hypothetical protein
VVRPPTDDPEEDNESTLWTKALENQETKFEIRIKSQALRGIEPSDLTLSWTQATSDIVSRAATARHLDIFSDIDKEMDQHAPCKFPIDSSKMDHARRKTSAKVVLTHA